MQGIPYDYKSVMHNAASVFSRTKMLKVIKPFKCVPLGLSKTPTPLDILHLNLLYCGGMYAVLLHCIILKRINLFYYRHFICH